MMDLEESTLLAAIAAGDRQAFEEFYRRYHRPVAGFLFKMTGRPGLVEELVNDVMVVVWQKAGSFAGRSRVSTWVMGIAYKKALKAVRRLGRAAVEVEIEPQMPTDSPGPDVDLARNERRQAVQRAVAMLSPKHRAVVELTYYYGYSYGEIAVIVDCPENTVKTRMYHARRKLDSLLPFAPKQQHEQDGRTGSR